MKQSQKNNINTGLWMIGVSLQSLLSINILAFDKGSNLKVSLGIGVVGIILQRYLQEIEPKKVRDKGLILHLAALGILCLIGILIEDGLYSKGISYGQWLRERESRESTIKEFEQATTLMINCLLFIGIYSKSILRIIKRDIIRYFSSLSVLAIVICIMLYYRPSDFSHLVRISMIILLTGSIAFYSMYQSSWQVIEQRQTVINIKYYFISFVLMSLLIGGGSCSFANIQELPGTRSLHHFISSIGARGEITQWIPYENYLNRGMSSSQAELFQVQASEPLYLRSIAYNEYRHGIWQLASYEGQEEMPLNLRYLQAEYTQSLLEEILWMHSKNQTILPQYAWLLNYETTVVSEKSYRIVQNPINYINYFTVNGFTEIIDEQKEPYYYYHHLNNNYFYSKQLVEPSDYIVTYKDRVPKVGSREYAFLHAIRAEEWQEIYEAVLKARKDYHLVYSGQSKVLKTYTPLIQYNNAKRDFLQVPDYLKYQLITYAQQIVGTAYSDWERAQVIADYLRENYRYSMQNKKQEKDRVSEFLFEEKEGICQDFATSMVLLCRSIGMPAKYVVGYRVQEKDVETGNYRVREKDAHAFVEVYIAGYGWMNFDPTPSIRGEDKMIREVEEENKGYSHRLNLVGGIAIGILFFILSKTGRKYLYKVGYCVRYKKSTPEQRVKMVMSWTLEALSDKNREKKNYETLSQYAQRIGKEGIDIRDIVARYEQLQYGLEDTTSQESTILLKAYKQLKKQLQKENK